MSDIQVTFKMNREKGATARSGRMMILDKPTGYWASVLFDLDPMSFENSEDRRGAFVVQEIFSNDRTEAHARWLGTLIVVVAHGLFNDASSKETLDITHEGVTIMVSSPGDNNRVHEKLREATVEFRADADSAVERAFDQAAVTTCIQNVRHKHSTIDVLEVGEVETVMVLLLADLK